MGTELPCQRIYAGGKEHSHLTLQAIQTMAQEHSCIRRNCLRIQLCKGVLDLVQRDTGQQAITQRST